MPLRGHISTATAATMMSAKFDFVHLQHDSALETTISCTWQGHEHVCHTGMPVRNGNLGTDRTTTTKAASVRKQLGTKNSKSDEGIQAKNGGVKRRDRSAEEFDRETGEEHTTGSRTCRNDGG